jgi:putative transcription factor
MSEDWDTVTKIGSKTRGGPGAPKEKVIRGESALNAARRTGAAISTEKKYGGGNTVSYPLLSSNHFPLTPNPPHTPC